MILNLKIFLKNKIIILQTLVGHTGGQLDIHPGDGGAHRCPKRHHHGHTARLQLLPGSFQ
jgi:hypothetical protein